MRLALLLTAAAATLAMVPLAVGAATPPPAPVDTARPLPVPSGGQPATVTVTGDALIEAPLNALTVYMVQLQGNIDPKDPNATLDAYVAKLERIRQAVITAGVPPSAVTAASFTTNPLGASPTVAFNSVFRYEVRPDATSVAAAQAAFAAGATMVYNNMPAPAVGVRRPDASALDSAIAEAKRAAHAHAVMVAAPRSVGDARATTLVLEGNPSNAPISWRVLVTMTFETR